MTEEKELSFIQEFIVFGLLFIGGVTLLLSAMMWSYLGAVVGIGTALCGFMYETQCRMRDRVDS